MVHGLGRALIEQGCEVTVATTTANGADELPVGTRVIDGIQVHYFQRIRYERLISLVPYFGDSVGFFYSRDLRGYLQENIAGFDLVHLHDIFTYPVLIGGRLAAANGVPYVVQTHGMLNQFRFRRRRLKKELFLRWYGAEVLAGAKALIALTDSERQQIIKSGLCNAPPVIPNGVDLNGYYPNGTAGKLCREVLYLGRIHPVKGLDLLLRAFAAVARNDRQVRLIIAGPDENGYERELKGLSHSLNLSSQVEFTGFVDGERKQALLKNADVFALTSYSEGHSMALLEALACGKPALITEGCNFAAVADHDAGFVTGYDVDEISRRLATLLSDDALRAKMSLNARDLIRKSYTWSIIGGKMLELYGQILAENECDC